MSDDRIAAHLDWLRRVTESADTLKHRCDVLRRVDRSLPVPLHEATAEQLDQWQAGLRISRSAVATYTSHVRGFFTWLQDSGRRDDNPAAKLPQPRIQQRLPRPIPERHLKLAFRVATGDMTVWLALAGWCGLRAGEIARLRSDDVLDEDDGMLLHVHGKGGRERVVPVPADVAPLVRRARRPGVLFRRPRGGPATSGYISQTAGTFLRGVGLPYTLHQLRHRFGTEFYRISKDIRQTQELMGHSTPATTSLYVAVVQRAAQKPLNRLGKSLPKGA